MVRGFKVEIQIRCCLSQALFYLREHITAATLLWPAYKNAGPTWSVGPSPVLLTVGTAAASEFRSSGGMAARAHAGPARRRLHRLADRRGKGD